MLKGKVCLVTGTNRGIGKGIAERFVSEGAVVYATARKDNSLLELSDECMEKYGTTINPLYFDVTDAKGQKDAIMQIKKEQDRLDVLVNNAGIMKDSVIGMISKDLMTEVFDVNVYATISMMQLAYKLMRRQKSGSIINMTSIAGTNGSGGQVVYSAAKGAVISLTKAAAKELAPYGIRVNAVAPGMIDTDLFRSIGEKQVEYAENNIGMGRLGQPEDVANTMLYLASDLSQYVTGQIIGVDGSAIL